MWKFAAILKIAKQFEKFAADKDYKDLVKINLSKLRETKPKPDDMDPQQYYSELAEEAKDGPIFKKNLLVQIARLQEHSIPTNNRKQFIRWLANSVKETHNMPNQNEMLYIKDFIDGSGDNFDFSKYTWDQLMFEANQWHEEKFYKEAPDLKLKYKTNDVVYSFKNGYHIVSVTDPEDLETEGKTMQHCVGGYCDLVASGGTKIYSLRDQNNDPHATMETSISFDDKGNTYEEIAQIKGKQNKPPVKKYQDMIKQWLADTFEPSEYADTYDYLAIANEKDIDVLLDITIRNFKEYGLEPDEPDAAKEKVFEFLLNDSAEITPERAKKISDILINICSVQYSGDYFGYFPANNISKILKLASKPYINKNLYDKIVNKFIDEDISIFSKYNQRGGNFSLMTTQFNDVPNIKKIRDDLIERAATKSPLSLAMSGNGFTSRYWPYVKGAVKKVLEHYVNDTDLNGMQININDIFHILDSLPNEHIFDKDFSAGISKYVNELTRGRSMHGFEKIFLFPETKIGEAARPFAELWLESSGPEWNRRSPKTSANTYFEKGYGNVKEIDDINFKMAQILSHNEPLLFFKRNFDKDPRFEKLINHAKLRMFYIYNGEDIKWVTREFDKAALNKDEFFFDASHYPSPEHYTIVIERVLDNLKKIMSDVKNTVVGKGLQKNFEAIKNYALESLDKLERKHETGSQIQQEAG